jgi:hypothetical protein
MACCASPPHGWRHPWHALRGPAAGPGAPRAAGPTWGLRRRHASAAHRQGGGRAWPRCSPPGDPACRVASALRCRLPSRSCQVAARGGGLGPEQQNARRRECPVRPAPAPGGRAGHATPAQALRAALLRCALAAAWPERAELARQLSGTRPGPDRPAPLPGSPHFTTHTPAGGPEAGLRRAGRITRRGTAEQRRWQRQAQRQRIRVSCGLASVATSGGGRPGGPAKRAAARRRPAHPAPRPPLLALQQPGLAHQLAGKCRGARAGARCARPRWRGCRLRHAGPGARPPGLRACRSWPRAFDGDPGAHAVPWRSRLQDLKDAFRQCGNVVYANVTRGDDGEQQRLRPPGAPGASPTSDLARPRGPDRRQAAPGQHPTCRAAPRAGRSKGWGIVEFETPDEVGCWGRAGPGGSPAGQHWGRARQGRQAGQPAVMRDRDTVVRKGAVCGAGAVVGWC